MIHCVFIEIICILLLSLYCFSDRIKQQCDIPFGGMYVLFLAAYFGVCLTYELLYCEFANKSMLEISTLCLGFVFLPAMFMGMKNKCFCAAYLAILGFIFSLTAWTYMSESSLFVLVLPLLACSMLCYIMDSYNEADDAHHIDEEPVIDLLNRKKEYGDIFDEIRRLAWREKKQKVISPQQGDNNKQESNGVEGMNLALCSPWGSGKSHFLKNMRCALRVPVEQKNVWSDAFEVRNIDLWKIASEEELWDAVNDALLGAVVGERKAYLFSVEKTLMHTFLQISTDAKAAHNIYKLIHNRQDNFSLDEIKLMLLGRRVMLIFEDLERARPEILVALLPLLDRIRKIHNVFTICAIDREELQRKLKRVGVDFQSYMSKVFDRNLYLSSAGRKNIENMQSALLGERFNTSTLIPSLLTTYKHHFETPRKLIRVFETLDGIERLYFRKLSDITNFSFVGCENVERLFALFVVCEVEMIRACEPELLKQIVFHGGVADFMASLPENELVKILQPDSDDLSSTLEDIPSNIRIYRALSDDFYKKYGKMRSVLMDNGCVCYALAHLYSYRGEENFEAYFMYAYEKKYVSESNFVEKLMDAFLKKRNEDDELEYHGADRENVPLSNGAVKQIIKQAMSKRKDGTGCMLSFAEMVNIDGLIDSLREYNSMYPYRMELVTPLSSRNFVSFMLDCCDESVVHENVQGKGEELLYELYRTMHIGEQAHVLTPAFHLKNSKIVESGMDGRYQKILSSSYRLNQILKNLCVLYGEHLYALIMSSRFYFAGDNVNENLYDYHLQAYKSAAAANYLASFYRGITRAAEKHVFSLYDALISFVHFLGVRYMSSNFISDENSTYATPTVVATMRVVYETIRARNLSPIMDNEQISIFRKECEKTRGILRKDYESWVEHTANSPAKTEHLSGISGLLQLLEEIMNTYI